MVGQLRPTEKKGSSKRCDCLVSKRGGKGTARTPLAEEGGHMILEVLEVLKADEEDDVPG